MELNVSGLKSFSFRSNINQSDEIIPRFVENNKKQETESKVDELIIKHIEETDTKLSHFKKLCDEGKISESDLKFESLQACAEDLIYQLGIKSFYKKPVQ